MTRVLPRTEVGLTVRDQRGNHLVFEIWDNGQIYSWSLDADENGTHSVALTENDRLRIAAFLLDGLS